MTESIALKSMPFDSNEVYNEATGETSFDRVAFSKDLADWMRNYFSNGILVKGSKVIADELQVTHAGGLNLSVNKGEVIINGRTGWVESAKELTVDMGGSADRIDRVVMELNVSDRYIYLKLLKGTEAETPEAPALTQTEDIFQIPLAQVRVNAETAVVASVTDERPDYISNVTIGIEPPTANSAVAISVSDDVKNLIGADNVDDVLKKIPYTKKIGQWELINDVAFNIPHTDFNEDGTYPYSKVITQDFIVITKEMFDEYSDFYISHENLHIDFTCVYVNASSSKYGRTYKASITPSFLSKEGEKSWSGTYWNASGETNVSKDFVDGRSYVFKKNIDAYGVPCLFDFIEIEINKGLIWHTGDYSHGDNGTKLTFDENGNIVFRAEISCSGYNSGSSYGATGNGAFSGNIHVYGRKGSL